MRSASLSELAAVWNWPILRNQAMRNPRFGIFVARFLSCLAAASMLLLCGCSEAGNPAIVGKWKVKDSDHVIEIRKDGKWVEAIDKDAQVTSSTWEWDDTNHVRLTMNSKLVGKASGVMKVSLNGDSLILKDEDGATEYTRVK
jgi:outer membrane biogenesis lipoprotein LolB